MKVDTKTFFGYTKHEAERKAMRYCLANPWQEADMADAIQASWFESLMNGGCTYKCVVTIEWDEFE